MTTAKDIDVTKELQKSKANVALLENLLQIREQKDNQELAVSNNKAEVKDVSAKLGAAKGELDRLKSDLATETEGHKVKTAEWKEKNEKLQRILFNAEVSSNISSDNDEDLEEAAKLAQENAALFKQRLRIRQLSSGIKVKSPDFESMEISLMKKKDTQQLLETQLDESKAVLAAGKEEYHHKMEAEFNSSTVAVSLNSQLCRVKNDMLGRDQTIKTQKTKITELESIIKSKDEAINSQEIQLKDAFERGRSLMFRQMTPLAHAGRLIRSRKLEWEKNAAKNQDIVGLGNKASHYGMALADASLYQDFCPDTRTDPQNYIDIYGVHPDFVWMNRDCNLFLDILDWRGAMKDFYPQSYHRTSYGSTKFCTLSKAFLTTVNEKKPTDWTVSDLNNYLKDSEVGSKMYKELKVEHDAGLVKHQIYLKNK